MAVDRGFFAAQGVAQPVGVAPGRVDAQLLQHQPLHRGQRLQRQLHLLHRQPGRGIVPEGLTVEKVERKDPEGADDLYLTLKNGETSMNFCVEIYLTGEDSDVYKTAIELVEGDVVDVTGYIYWYEGPNPHITAIEKVAA